VKKSFFHKPTLDPLRKETLKMLMVSIQEAPAKATSNT